jgi:hypothetical protein
MATIEMWTFTVATPPNIDLTGFKVEATDGSIGKVDESTHDTGGSFIVVDTGPWIFGKIDPDTETIFVARTKDEIKNAPEFDEERYHEASYRNELGSYYGNRATTRSGQGL